MGSGTVSPHPRRRDEDARRARAIWAAGEPFTLAMLVADEGRQALGARGVPGRGAYVVTRSAPLGRADPAVVTAAFHGFPEAVIREVLPSAWELIDPKEVIELHHASLPLIAERVFGDTVDSADVRLLANVLTGVCTDLDTSGRPLAAGNRAVAAPDEPWARLWHACTTLREYRGDAHVAALVTADLGVAESLVLTAAWAPDRIDADMLRTTRRLSDGIIADARGALIERDLLSADGRLTGDGVALRDDVENRTDQAAARPWSVLAAADLAWVYRLLASLSSRMIDTGSMRAVTPVGAPWPPPPFDRS